MVLNADEIKNITSFVKKEPRTVQDIAKHIGKTWATAESYVEKIIQKTGLLRVKVFRQGTQGAIKLVFWNYGDAVEHDEIKKFLFERIRLGKAKTDIDPLDIYQYIPASHKRAFLETVSDPTYSSHQNLRQLLAKTEQELFCFSGNNSWISLTEKETPVIAAVEQLLQRKALIRILCRVDLATLENLYKLSALLEKYPQQLEIRHAVQPLRGFIIDSKIVRIKDEKEAKGYKKGELRSDVKVFYEWTDPDWVHWTQQVFWNLYRHAPTAEQRLQELHAIF